MVVNFLNYPSVDETIEFAKNNPHIKSISLNLHTLFPNTEYLTLDDKKQIEVLDKVIFYKKKRISNNELHIRFKLDKT